MRYARQEIFQKIGKENQKKLAQASVTIVGIGALGTTVLDMLARAGVGNIKIIDRDIIELNNLQRQTLFTEEDVNKPKVTIAKEKIAKINSEIKIEAHLIDLDYDNIDVLSSDLILDCTDNMYTRFLINEYTRKNNIPWIYASVIGAKGMTMNITKDTPCLSCMFQEPTEALDTCDTAGVLNTTPHALGAIEVTEAIKILTNQEYHKGLIHYDLWKNQITKITIKKSKNCKTCNQEYEYLTGKKANSSIKICGSCNFQIKTKPINIKELHRKIEASTLTNDCLILKDMILFKSGRALIKAVSKEQAKTMIDRYLG